MNTGFKTKTELCNCVRSTLADVGRILYDSPQSFHANKREIIGTAIGYASAKNWDIYEEIAEFEKMTLTTINSPIK